MSKVGEAVQMMIDLRERAKHLPWADLPEMPKELCSIAGQDRDGTASDLLLCSCLCSAAE